MKYEKQWKEDLKFGELSEQLVAQYLKERNYKVEKVDHKKYHYDLSVSSKNKELRVEVKTLRPEGMPTMILEMWSDWNKKKRPHHFRNCDVLVVVNWSNKTGHVFKCDEVFWSYLESQPKYRSDVQDNELPDGGWSQKFIWPDCQEYGFYEKIPSFCRSFSI